MNMNDNDFDSYIRKSLERIEGLDPTSDSLQDFQSRVQSLPRTTWPWRYRVPLATAAVLMLFTFVNGMMYLYRDAPPAPVHVINTVGKDDYKHEVDSLIIYTNLLRSEVNSSMKMIAQMNRAQAQKVTNAVRTEAGEPLSENGQNGFDLGAVNSISPEVMAKLEKQQIIELRDGHAFLVVGDSVVRTKRIHYEVEYVMSPQDIQRGDSTIRQVIALKNPVIEKIKPELPAAIINKLEEHSYRGGIGLTLSPHVDIIKTNFSKGDGDVAPRIGIRADWILSAHWSVQTSLDYLSNRVTISDNFQNYNLPNLSSSLGTLQHVGITNYMIGVPIALRYKWWVSSNYQLQVSAGVTPYFSVDTQYKYFYPFPGRPQDSDVSLATVTDVGKQRYNNSTAAVSFGVIKSLKKNRSFELSAYFEQGMLSASREHLATNMIGLRTALTFPVKGR
jgi:Outer membrane protein beta-barrel domain